MGDKVKFVFCVAGISILTGMVVSSDPVMKLRKRFLDAITGNGATS